MQGGGAFGLRPGEWTDDTSMALCLAESLIEKDRFDAWDQLARYVDWWRNGHLSSNGTCFDIGGTTLRALADFEQTGNVVAVVEGDGNGSLMRLAPVVMWGHFAGIEESVRLARMSSRTTHSVPSVLDACALLAVVISNALDGKPRDSLLDGVLDHVQTAPVKELAEGGYRGKVVDEIESGGWYIESLEAALWCIHHTSSFSAAVLKAVNLGDDADTTAAITGQIAGALYGVGDIPSEWLEVLCKRELITSFADKIHDRWYSVK